MYELKLGELENDELKQICGSKYLCFKKMLLMVHNL